MLLAESGIISEVKFPQSLNAYDPTLVAELAALKDTTSLHYSKAYFPMLNTEPGVLKNG